MMVGSNERFVVLGGPGGRLACVPAGSPCLTDYGASYGYVSRWQPLFTVNRPLTPRMAAAAEAAALRRYELAP